MIDDESSTVEVCPLHAACILLVRPMRIECSENGLVLSNYCVCVICSKRNENEISTDEGRLNSDQ